jgi:hypothetical protein
LFTAIPQPCPAAFERAAATHGALPPLRVCVNIFNTDFLYMRDN